MALKDKLMTLEDFKAVRDVDVASNSAQFTEIKADLGDVQDNLQSELNQISIAIPSSNLLNLNEIVTGKFIRKDGTVGNGSNYAHTGFIPVSEGDNVVYGDSNTIYDFRFVTAYDADKNAVTEKGQEYGTSYTVPSGISYIIISATPVTRLTSETSKINIGYNLLPYEPYGNTYEPKRYDRLLQISKVKQSTNWLNPDDIKTGFINLNGVESVSSSNQHTGLIPVSENETIIVGYGNTVLQARYITAYDGNKHVLPSLGSEYSYLYTVPAGVSFVVISTTTADSLTQDTSRVNKSPTLLPYEPYYWAIPNGFDTLQEITEKVTSTNLLNNETAVIGKAVNLSGTESNYTSMVHTNYIEVSPNEKIYLVNDGVADNPCNFRYVTAYDINKNVLSNRGQEYVTLYTVPADVAFIICTVKKSYYDNGKLAINKGFAKPYEPYYNEERPKGVKANTDYRLSMMDTPLSTLPEYMLNLLSYRPLGTLEKGYICLVSDDGNALLNTYTIPMLLSKGVPATFALMQSSDVMQSQADIDIVKNAITNGGCSVAQHGGRNWTEFDEKGLNDFFDSEQTFFDSVGITIEGAVIPSHYTTRLISALAGGRFGVVRSGYDGHIEVVKNYYDYYTSGARSNIFALSAFNVADLTTQAMIETRVNYAISEKKILIVYWHENSMTDSHKSMLEGLIDYAKTSGLTFCTLGDIPNLK